MYYKNKGGALIGGNVIKVLKTLIACIFISSFLLQGQGDAQVICADKRLPDYVAEGFKIAWDFNLNFFSWDTVKIIAAFTPFYVASRYIDKEIQSCFYCAAHHKNIRQLPKTCYHIANNGVTAVLVGLVAFSVLPVKKEIKDTAIVFGITLPFMWAWKKILKEIKTEGCRRPRNQYFSKHKKGNLAEWK